MTEEQITQDRQKRVAEAKVQIEQILKTHELSIQAEDMIGEHTKISVMLQFRDEKKYDSPIAQEEKPIISPKEFMEDVLESGNDKIE